MNIYNLLYRDKKTGHVKNQYIAASNAAVATQELMKISMEIFSCNQLGAVIIVKKKNG